MPNPNEKNKPIEEQQDAYKTKKSTQINQKDEMNEEDEDSDSE